MKLSAVIDSLWNVITLRNMKFICCGSHEIIYRFHAITGPFYRDEKFNLIRALHLCLMTWSNHPINDEVWQWQVASSLHCALDAAGDCSWHGSKKLLCSEFDFVCLSKRFDRFEKSPTISQCAGQITTVHEAARSHDWYKVKYISLDSVFSFVQYFL